MLKTIILISQILSLTCYDFNTFVKKYNKRYDLDDYIKKENIFNQNVEYINEKNKLLTTYKLGINKFADMTFEEFSKTHLMKPMSFETNYESKQKYQLDNQPENFDWRTEGVISNIKDQGDCGSCWAFSTVSAIEAAYAIKNKLVTLSEQNVVDCVPQSYNCYGCGGGWPYKAMEYISENGGVDTEKSYPYKGANEDCYFNSSNVGALIKTYHNVSINDNALQYNLYNKGPLSIAIFAGNNFMFYDSGIYDPKTEDCPVYVNHAVTIIGYGTNKEGTRYYIIRNSWGTSWGMDGYILWSRDPICQCGICNYACYVEV